MNDEAADKRLQRLVGLARESFDDEPSKGQMVVGLERLERSLMPAPRSARWRWMLAVGAAGAAAAAVAGGVGLRPQTSALTLKIEGGTMSDGGYIRETDGPVALHFSEGTEFALAAGSRARVTGLDAQGAHVLIESGAARVHVTPRPRARWSVDAGPYTIRVTGTAFDVAWSGRDEVMDLSLHNGSVVVTGPLAAQGLVLEPGQHLLANVKSGVIRLDRRRVAAAATDMAPPAEVAGEMAAPMEEAPLAPATAPAVETPEPVLPAGAGARSHRVPAVKRTSSSQTSRPELQAPAPRPELQPAASRSPSWSARLSHGEFKAIVADAEGRGIAQTLDGASVEDLAALADAARYARRNDLAERTLLAERRRFPGSVPGRDAAFFLGGLAEEPAGHTAAATALGWYERYLRESPRGTYAGHALGRKMAMEERLGERAAAREAAQEYLRRFPSGPHADRARALLDK